jgi:hypothetical protein
MAWADYGGRGISVCERWSEFDNFLADMGRRPSPEHTIDRKDNNGNYEPGNCQWATRLAQGGNKRNNVVLTANGYSFTLSQWSKITGIGITTISHRINHGWDTKKALTEPTGRVRK